jgi:hypothetical protein
MPCLPLQLLTEGTAQKPGAKRKNDRESDEDDEENEAETTKRA